MGLLVQEHGKKSICCLVSSVRGIPQNRPAYRGTVFFVCAMRYTKLMFLALIGVIFSVFLSLAIVSFWVGVPAIHREESPSFGVPHRFDNPGASIARIRMSAFYFVPKNKVARKIDNWQEILDMSLRQLQHFHTFQFHGRSTLEFRIFPVEIMGHRHSVDYDTDATAHGNPEGLRRVAAEIEERVFQEGGDLYRAQFAKRTEDFYDVSLILYEGVGASGSDNVAFVSRVFLTDPQYAETGVTTVAHEFYHTLGIPDAYDLATAIPTAPDLMGSGRDVPLRRAYLSWDTLSRLGL